MNYRFLFSLLFSLSLSSVYPQGKCFVQKLVPSDRAEGDNFGWSCAIHDDYAVVSAIEKKSKQHQSLIQNVGAVYIFKKNNTHKWEQLQKLEPDVSKANTFFGRSVCISNNYLMIGADGEDDGEEDKYSTIRKGAVYIYIRSGNGTWSKIQKLKLTDRKSEDEFGYSISMSDSFLAVAAPGKLFSERCSGAVYLYKLQPSGGWKNSTMVQPLNRDYKRFGRSICISGNQLIISDDNNAVYVYKIVNGNKLNLETILHPTVANDRLYGNSLDMYKNFLVIGAQGDFDAFEGKERPATDSLMQFIVEDPGHKYKKVIVFNSKRLRDSLRITPQEFKKNAITIEPYSSRLERMAGAGAVYIYAKSESNGWTLQQRILASDSKLDAHFGNSVGISDSMIVVAAFGDRLDSDTIVENIYAGAVYVFKLNNEENWIQVQKIMPDHRTPFDKFGFSIDVYKRDIIVGSRFEKEDAREKNILNEAGAAYLYQQK